MKKELVFSVPTDRPFKLIALGDTHLNRGEHIGRGALDAITAQVPDLILHTGDIIDPDGLAPLQELAPLLMVRGNRDLLRWFALPARIALRIGERSVLLFHGHGTLPKYLQMKCLSLRRDPSIFRTNRAFPREATCADLVIYGHTHHPRLEMDEARLIINPGALTTTANLYGPADPSFAVITIAADGDVHAAIRARSIGWHECCNVLNVKAELFGGKTS